MTTPTSSRAAERLTPGAARFLLAVAYLCLAALYAWQASKRVSPTIFSDEIEFTQISRGIAEHGVPSRRGEPSGFGSLYTYLVAPAWWLDPESAWEAAKLIGVLVMTATIFPAYGLARFVVSRPWALAAAIIAVAAPPLAYAPYLLDEPLAYPVSTAALVAIMAAVARPTRRRLLLAGAVCLVAPLVRGELAVLLAVFGAALFVLLYRTERFTRWRTTWTTGDWVGAAMLVVGAAVLFSAVVGHRSDAWYVATGFQKHRVLDYGTWALAAMTIGLGVLPVVATVAAFSVAARPGNCRGSGIRRRRGGGVCRLRDLRGGQGRVPLDGLLEPDRRTQRDLSRPRRARGDGGCARTTDRDLARARPWASSSRLRSS